MSKQLTLALAVQLVEALGAKVTQLEQRVAALEGDEASSAAAVDPVRAGLLRFRDRCRARERGDA